MGKFIKKPVIIEAIQWTGDNKLEISEFVQDSERKYDFQEDALFIHTLEGSMRASVNDYIIKGVSGEFYPCKPEIFEKTYADESAIGELSDGYHTYNELYDFRKMYNAALFNEWAMEDEPKYDVHKSWKHYDGEDCFGGGWFIVVAILPTGQISNHYPAADWDLFKVPETPTAKYEFDGHTPQDVLERLTNICK